MINTFRDLDVYQQAFILSIEIHKISLNFPQFEQFELASQLRRASKSIAVNIAEGYGKNSSLPEFKRFLSIALGSNDEVRAWLDYCKTLKYISDEQYKSFEERYVFVGKMITNMLKNWQKF